MSSCSAPEILEYTSKPVDCGLLILAAGFEDRAFEFIGKTDFNNEACCILIRFDFNIPCNDEVYEKYRKRIKSCFPDDRFFEIVLDQNIPKKYERDLDYILSKLPKINGEAWIDISGMPTYVICNTLNSCRSLFQNKEQIIIYTAADNYFPTKEEYEKLKEDQSEGVEFLPKSMALEMSEVLILESFSGYRSKEGVSCLVVFAGYDVHRSSGVIESINPSALLFLYGNPGDSNLDWRLDLSKQLHKRFESTRKAAAEIVSTLDPRNALDILEEYYEYLFEDYDLTITPVCSKMQAVAAYLFWERYREIQLVFPLPIGYSMDRRPKGVGCTYITRLATRNALYR